MNLEGMLKAVAVGSVQDDERRPIEIVAAELLLGDGEEARLFVLSAMSNMARWCISVAPGGDLTEAAMHSCDAAEALMLEIGRRRRRLETATHEAGMAWDKRRAERIECPGQMVPPKTAAT